MPEYGPQGWIDDQKEVELIASELEHAYFGDAAPSLKGSGKNTINLLHNNFDKLGIKFPHQVQKIGDCVSFAAAHITDTLAVTEIANGEREEWKAMTATEYLYSVSRINIGGGRLSGDGSVGAWVVKGMKSYGTLIRQKYSYVDLSVYSGSRAKSWGSKGLPKTLLDIGKEHVIDNYSLCKNSEDVCDSIANDNPVIICSRQGFSNRRDKDGFCKPSGSWSHAMAIIAVDTKHKRPGVLILNSWPLSYISGPKRHNQPQCSFWADLDVIDRMCRMNDTWAISGFNGYEKSNRDVKWWENKDA